ncbi:helix-turn-helix domain-containing protein [Streptomyces albidoflavus]|uniref:helix-turn-helix domain-containing protein n=1 Tax=Streptomyces albidoflavus TaxID=1886 RepID=UPI003403FCD2
MQYATPSCQLPRAHTGDSRQKSTPQVGELAPLNTPANAQWISTTTGRIAGDGYSWMQAVHWTSGSGLYTPTRNHGPKWGPTTIVIAQEIANLTECRPSVDYLARKLRCSTRTVKYHLGMLREAGLLVYRSKGNRITGSIRHASVYERVIPVAFDEALGIRCTLRDTTQPAHTRAPVGIAEEGRKLIGQLAKKATRKTRRRTRRTPVSRGQRCTLREGGTSASSSAGISTGPSESSKLASGTHSSPTPKQSKRALNKVGRRYQLAGELIALMPWLSRAPKARVAWVARHVADAGWTALEVQAVVEQDRPVTDGTVRRGSALLACRLRGVHELYDTPSRRQTAVAHWRDQRCNEHARHEAYDLITGPISSGAVRRLVQGVVNRLHQPAPEPVSDEETFTVVADTEDTVTVQPVEFDDETKKLNRRAARADHNLVTAALASGMTEDTANALFGADLVSRAQGIAHATARGNLRLDAR